MWRSTLAADQSVRADVAADTVRGRPVQEREGAVPDPSGLAGEDDRLHVVVRDLQRQVGEGGEVRHRDGARRAVGERADVDVQPAGIACDLRLELLQHREQDPLLVLGPAEHRAGHVVPRSGHRERLRTVQMLKAGVDGGSRVRVVDRIWHVDREAADLVDHRLHAAERGDQVVVDMDAAQRLDGLDGEIRAAGGHRLVDLVDPDPGDRHLVVAVEAEDRSLVLLLIDADHLKDVGMSSCDGRSGAGVAPDREDEDRAGPADRNSGMGGAKDDLRIVRCRRLRRGLEHTECGPGDPRRQCDQGVDPVAQHWETSRGAGHRRQRLAPITPNGKGTPGIPTTLRPH
jgi:hypothetical protein